MKSYVYDMFVLKKTSKHSSAPECAVPVVCRAPVCAVCLFGVSFPRGKRACSSKTDYQQGASKTKNQLFIFLSLVVLLHGIC